MARKPSANHTTAAATIEPPHPPPPDVPSTHAPADQPDGYEPPTAEDLAADPGHLPPGWRDDQPDGYEPPLGVLVNDLAPDDAPSIPWTDESPVSIDVPVPDDFPEASPVTLDVTPADQPPSYRIEKSEDFARNPNPWHVIDNWTNTVVSRHGTVTDARTARDQRMGTA